METTLVTEIYLVALLLALPVLSAGEEALERAAEEMSDRRPLYASAAASLVIVAAVTWGVAAWSGVEARALGWRTETLASALGWSLAATAVGLAGAWALTRWTRRLGWEESRAVLFLLPRDRGERRWFVLLALAAAVCEEYVYRGFALHALMAWSGEAWVAVAATSVSFGFAHGYQRAAGVLRATFLGAVLALPVVWTGSLFPAVAAHFWINAVIGLGGWRWLAPELEDRR